MKQTHKWWKAWINENHLFLTVLGIITTAFIYGSNGDIGTKQAPPLIGIGTVKQKLTHFLDNTTNKWLTFDDWQCSAPHEVPHSLVLASYYSYDSCGERILVVSPSSSASGISGMKSWSYRVKTNSWKMIETGRNIGYFSTSSCLVTVCQSNVLYIVGLGDINSSVWRFDGLSEVWSRELLVDDTAPIIVGGESASYLVLRNNRTASLSTSCVCSHLVVGFSRDMRTVWKLSCDDMPRRYVWNNIEAGHDVSQFNETLYPRNAVYSTAKVVTEEGFILMMAENGLWKYDLYYNRWFSLDSAVEAFYTDTAAYYHFKWYIWANLGINRMELNMYNLHRHEWRPVLLFSEPQPLINVRNVISLTTESFRFLLYTGSNQDCYPPLWELHKLSDKWEWSWKKLDASLSPPLSAGDEKTAAGSANCVGNTLYVLVVVWDSVSSPKRLQLWELQLNRMAWGLLTTFLGPESRDKYITYTNPISLCTAVIHGNVVLTFYSGILEDKLLVVAHNEGNISWVPESSRNGWPMRSPVEARRDFCVVPINSSTILLYGGKSLTTPYRYFCDVWVVTLQSPNSSYLQWSRLQSDCVEMDRQESRRPSYGSMSACVVINDSLLVLGGGLENEESMDTVSCLRNVWQFSISSKAWTRVFVQDTGAYDHQMCITSALLIADQVIATFHSLQNIPGSELRRYELWFYFIRRRTWALHSEMASTEQFLPFIWNRLIIFFGKDLRGMSYKKLVCPHGYSSPDIYDQVCTEDILPLERGRRLAFLVQTEY